MLKQKPMRQYLSVFMAFVFCFLMVSPVYASSFCGCYRTNNDCGEVPVKYPLDNQAGCETTCKKGLMGNYASADYTNSAVDLYVKQAKCTAAHELVFKEKKEKETSGKPSNTKELAAPILNVPIPNLTFSPAVVSGNSVESSFLSEYLSAVYQYLIKISVTIAVVMVMVAGLQYVLASGSGKAAEAKKRITNATVGLVLLLCVYLILYTVNPQLVLLKTIRLQNIPEQPLPEERAVSGTFGKKMLKDFAEAPPKFNEPTVPPASSCGSQSSRNKKLTSQADRDAAFAIQKKYGYPAAVLLAQRIVEGKTFGIKCGSFLSSAKGDQSKIDELACESKPNCGNGFTWECVKPGSKHLPPAAPGKGSPPDGADCGKGEKAGKGYTAVHGYSCFLKPDESNPFGPLINFYEKRGCFKGAKEKYGGNPEAFAYAVQACGYATAQGYAGMLVNVMKKNCLWDGKVKEDTSKTADAADEKTETP